MVNGNIITPPRVVITGVGIASSLGNDVSDFQRALFDGEYGIRVLSDLPFPNTAQTLGAPLRRFPEANCVAPEQKGFLSNLSQVSLYCAEKALHCAGLPQVDMNPARVGVVLGSGMGNLADLEPTYRRFFGDKKKRVSPLTIPINMASAAPSQIAMQFGLRGVCQTISTACASGLTAIVEGFHLISAGRQEAVLCGGVDLLFSETNLRGWEAMRVLSLEKNDPRLACRPFDQARSGMVLGEGAALLVLEMEQNALRRGARILATVSGTFLNSDAADMVKPDLNGQAECIVGALKKSGLPPEAIQLVQSHGTATELNDKTESQALSNVFKRHLSVLYLCAIKGQIGHTLGASGALAVTAALASFHDGYVYPVPNYEATDIPYDLNIHSVGIIDEAVEHILINAFGFGGVNSCVILSK